MRVSLGWLKELVDIDLSVEELRDRLDMTGTAVEAVESAGQALDDVVVGEVLVRDKHPDADKLSYCKVDIGAEEPLDIVCGADNFKAGDKVPVALIGALLPNGMKIRKSKIRGCVSHGMMCSPIELGLGTEASGLMILPLDAPVGQPFARYHGLEDVVFELEVTPNRPDCLSVAGVAREVGAILGTEAAWPTSELEESGGPTAERVSVSIEDADLCSRYTARVIEGVRIGPSPAWLAEKLAAAGARPINNIVDVTNYVMFELGQPLHAFDLSTLEKDDEGRAAIIVRTAQEGEPLITLDGQERDLTQDMLLICDPKGPIALAGVMGGQTTEVSEETVDILLESASFDPASSSRTSRTLGLVSEASLRFEKRVDPAGCAAAADRAAALIAEIAGGTVASGIVDEYPRPAQERCLDLRMARMQDFLGAEIPLDEAMAILERLGLSVSGGPDVLKVGVPTFRPDLTREVDLYEEIVRVWGMDSVPSTLPGGRERVGGLTRDQHIRARIGLALRAAGLNDATSYSFGPDSDVGLLGWEFGPGEMPVRLLNPMSEEQSVLRWTLAPGLLRAVAYNQRRAVPDVHLYEIGTVFLTAEGRKLPKERVMVAGALAGSWHRPSWNADPRPLDFFDAKGVLESLMEELHIPYWRVRSAEKPWLQPGKSAEVIVGGDVVGWVGEAHPTVLSDLEAEGPVAIFELSLVSLSRAARDLVDYCPVPRNPSVNLDLALVVEERVDAEKVEQVMARTGGQLLESIRLFDVYRGEGIPAGKKSLAYSLTYRASDRTLTDEEVSKVHDKVVRKVCGAVNAEVRG